MTALAYEQVDDIIVLVFGAEAPSDAEWDEYLAYVHAHRRPGAPLRTLVASDGGAPTLGQRHKLNEMMKAAGLDETLKVAVLTDSTSVRGVATRLSWAAKGYSTFAPTDVDGAFQHLDVSAPEASRLRQVLTTLRRQLA